MSPGKSRGGARRSRSVPASRDIKMKPARREAFPGRCPCTPECCVVPWQAPRPRLRTPRALQVQRAQDPQTDINNMVHQGEHKMMVTRLCPISSQTDPECNVDRGVSPGLVPEEGRDSANGFQRILILDRSELCGTSVGPSTLPAQLPFLLPWQCSSPFPALRPFEHGLAEDVVVVSTSLNPSGNLPRPALSLPSRKA